MADESKRGFFGRMFGARPPAPARVEPAPTLRPQTRRFKAATPGRNVGGFGRLLDGSPRIETKMDLRGLINNARTAAQNVDFIKSYEMMVRRHVIGPSGISLHIGADHAPDVRGAVAKAWREWGARGSCSVCGRLSWWQIEKTAATMLAREGNFFLRIWRGKNFGKFGFQVQPLSVDLLDIDRTEWLSDGSYIDGGIEYNSLDRVTAYHFWTGHPSEHYRGGWRGKVRIPARDMIHLIRQTETGQSLGVPESHTALRRFNLLSQYEEAAMTAAHYGAAAMVFLENLDGDAAPGDIAAAEAELPDEIEAGMIVDLPPGYTAKANPSNYPDANMPGFLKSLTRGGAAGLGVSYAALSSDMEGASFSSLKDGRGEERDEWRMWQRDMSEGLHGPLFKEWLPLAYLSKCIPGLSLSDLDGLQTEWRGRGWVSANPKDDATANDTNLRNRLVAPSDLAAERGQDFGDLIARYAQDLQLMRDAGIPDGDFLVKSAPASPPPEPTPDAPDGAPSDGAEKPEAEPPPEADHHDL